MRASLPQEWGAGKGASGGGAARGAGDVVSAFIVAVMNRAGRLAGKGRRPAGAGH